MLALALRQHDRREAIGQVLRLIVAAPGSMTGRYPVGNTGRVNAGLMTPMPIPDDLAAAIKQRVKPRPVRDDRGLIFVSMNQDRN